MAEDIKIVIIDSDGDTRDRIKEMFGKMPRFRIIGETADPSTGLELILKAKPDIVIMDLYPSPDNSLRTAEKITQAIPDATIFMMSLHGDRDMIIRAMRAGAREFLVKPLSDQDIVDAAKTIIRLQARKHSEGGRGGKIITVFGAKGGVGTTTLASNISVNLSEHTGRSAVLIDMNLQFGNAALFLNLKPKYSIIDVASHLDNLDPIVLRDSLPRHSSGVRLLAGPARIEDTEKLTTSHFEAIIDIMRTIFDYIVIDTGSVFDDFTLTALDESDKIVTVFTADIPAIYNTKRCIDLFKRMEFKKDKVHLVVNRHDSHSPISIKDLEKAVKYPVFWSIPHQDFVTAVSSVNQGVPLTTKNPKAKVSQSILKLAMQLNGSDPVAESVETKKSFNPLKMLFNK